MPIGKETVMWEKRKKVYRYSPPVQPEYSPEEVARLEKELRRQIAVSDYRQEPVAPKRSYWNSRKERIINKLLPPNPKRVKRL